MQYRYCLDENAYLCDCSSLSVKQVVPSQHRVFLSQKRSVPAPLYFSQCIFHRALWPRSFPVLTAEVPEMSCIMRKPALCICKNKDTDQLPSYAKLINAFVFATQIVQSLYFLNPKFQASSYMYLLLLHSMVCVGPVRKPVFSQRGSNYHLHESRREASACLIIMVELQPMYVATDTISI